MHYVGGTLKAFEKPLTFSEEKEYLEKFQNGDKSAFDVLVLRNMRLVAHMVKHYSIAEKDMDDMISTGTVGLIKAIKTFKPSKGSRLATYAAKCIENEILMALRNTRKRSREVSLQEPVGTDKEGNEISIIDVITADDENVLDEFIFKGDAAKMYMCVENCLTPREKSIIISRYGLYGEREQTQKEIAEKWSISRSYVSRIEKKAIEKMKIYFDTDGGR